jgi:hypothetical protein
MNSGYGAEGLNGVNGVNGELREKLWRRPKEMPKLSEKVTQE